MLLKKVHAGFSAFIDNWTTIRSEEAPGDAYMNVKPLLISIRLSSLEESVFFWYGTLVSFERLTIPAGRQVSGSQAFNSLRRV